MIKNNCKYKTVIIKPSFKSDKKFMAVFDNGVKTIHFGAKGYSDYTVHKDPKRKERYIKRHVKRENWNQCDTAGTLSRFVLWQYHSFHKSVKYYKNKFKLK